MTGLDAALVAELLDAFYAKVRRDEELGPVFDDIIGDRWPEHMQRINAFWLSALRIARGYHGPGFMPAHLKHATIRADLLDRWLALFERTVGEIAPESTHEALMSVAHAMADNLRISLSRRDG